LGTASRQPLLAVHLECMFKDAAALVLTEIGK
jgi:hypothetical protein